MHDDVVGGFIARHGADMLSALLVDRTTGRNIIWAYVESLRLEITCGEAPFICSRYDTVTGEPIPIRDRIGFLDRKLRVITERTKRNADWMAWAFKALTATYGYEYQGDNLLLARINVFETMCEHYAERWGEEPPDDAKRRMADIISWNLWQMDGLTNAVPTDAVETATHSVLTTSADKEPLILFNMEETSPQPLIRSSPRCLIYDWEQGKPMEFAQLGGLAA